MKNILLILSTLALILLFENCDKNEEYICGSESFIFLDENGNNIFDPNNESYIDTANFKVFTPELKEYPIIVSGSNNRLNTYIVNIGIKISIGEEDTTFFQFGDHNVDTIRAVYTEEGHIHIDEMYYNDSLIESFCNTSKVHRITVKPDSVYN
jgi:hypothetical protein